MKATGIVRRIDDLGRVVIPKEIRRTLRIREGDPLEIFTDREGEIILKKYSPIGELGVFAKQYAEALAQTSELVVCIVDRDQIIATAGNGKKELMNKIISKPLEAVIHERKTLVANKSDKTFIPVVGDSMDEYPGEVIVPIISQGDSIGAVIILKHDSKDKLGDVELKLATSAAVFLGRQLEQ